MKQNITFEQLNKLSEKEKRKLRKWWKPKDGDYYVGNGATPYIAMKYFKEEFPLKNHTIIGPLLSVGQMIEFLDKYDNDELCYALVNPDSNCYQPVNQLCDRLWEGIRGVLEN